MLRVGRVYNIIVTAVAALIIFIGFVLTLTSAFGADSSSSVSSSTLIMTGLVLGAIQIVAKVVVNKSQRDALYKAPSDKTPYILTIVFGAVSSNPFFIVCGIFGLIDSNQRAQSQSTSSRSNQAKSIPPKREEKPVSQPKPAVQPKPVEKEQKPAEKKDNFYVDTETETANSLNPYNDIILSYKEYRAMVSDKSCMSLTVGNIEISNVGNSFNMSSVNVSNDEIKLSINGIDRTYSTNAGIKGILIDGRKVYLGVADKEKFLEPEDSEEEVEDEEDEEENVQPLGDANVFDVSEDEAVLIKTGTAFVEIVDSKDESLRVYSDGGILSSHDGTTLIIDTHHCKNDVRIEMPEKEEFDIQVEGTIATLSLENVSANNISINLTSASVELTDVSCDDLSVKLTSGNLDAEIVAKNLSVTLTSGNADITHNYQEDGSARLTSTSGNIDYSMENVKEMKLSASGDYDDDFDDDDFYDHDGEYVANVTISTDTGHVNIS